MARERRGHPGKFLNAVEGGLNWALQSYPVSPARGWRGDFTSFITVTSGLLVKCHSSLCPHLCACLPPPTPPHASNSLTALSSLSRGPSQLLFSLNHPEQPSLAITSLEPSLCKHGFGTLSLGRMRPHHNASWMEALSLQGLCMPCLAPHRVVVVGG